MIGPESSGWSQPLHAPNPCAWMPKLPVHGGGCWPLPVPHVVPLIVPLVCVQSILIGCWPLESPMVKPWFPFGVQIVPVLSGLRLRLLPVLVSTATTLASLFDTANATIAWGRTVHVPPLVRNEKYWSPGAGQVPESVTPWFVPTDVIRGGWPALGVPVP